MQLPTVAEKDFKRLYDFMGGMDFIVSYIYSGTIIYLKGETADNFVGKTATETRWYYNRDTEYWCSNRIGLDDYNSMLATENETLLYIKKGFQNLTTIAISDIERNTTVNYFYCQPSGDYRTWEMIERERYEKSLMDQFDKES